ncbi:MAG: DMT family transporter [Patescibacteria group bacterium]|jgi:drug/metabolite transporter (DMT)-like permease
MSLGLILSLTAGLLWSFGNVLDKVSVTRIIKHPIGLLYIYLTFSAVAGLVILPLTTNVFVWHDAYRFAGVAVSYTLAMFFYFRAMQKEEPSRVVPLYALVVLFLSVFSAIFLGEIFNFVTYIAIVLLIVGTAGITSRGSIVSVFKSRALGLMIMSSLCYATAYTLIKSLLGTYTPYDVFVYQRLFIAGIGLLLLPFVFRRLKTIVSAIPDRKLIGLSVVSELLGETGGLLFVIASSVWYVTLVETAVNIEFVFIFIWGLVVTKFWPRLYTEGVDKKVILQKAFSIALILIGIAIISR